MDTATTGRIHLVRCPKCLTLLPEPENTPFYKCGGCQTILKAKTRRRETGSTESIRRSSEDYSNSTSLNAASHSSEKKSSASDNGGEQVTHIDQSSSNASATSKEFNMKKSSEQADNGIIDADEDCRLNDESSNLPMEDHVDASHHDAHSEANLRHRDSDKRENTNIDESLSESISESNDASHLPASEERREESNVAANKGSSDEIACHGSCELQEKPLNETDTLVTANQCVKSEELLYKHDKDTQTRRVSVSAEFHSVQTQEVTENDRSMRTVSVGLSLNRSNSFTSGEVLERKIMRTVDVLKDELSELFGQSAQGKAVKPSRLAKQEVRTRPFVSTSSFIPRRAYLPHVNAARRSRSAQIASHGGLSRHCAHCKADSCCHSGHDRTCRHNCCHHSKMECRLCNRQPCFHKAETQDAGWEKPPAKEARRQPKHHCRPILRAAPFVICPYCLKMVQLPADFAVSRKRLRKLQCGSCSEVVLYSYRDRYHRRTEMAGEFEHNTNDFKGHEMNNKHYADYTEGNPITYNEDNGLSFGRSYSTESESPLHVSRNSSSSIIDGRNGRLHRLMGYPSASELLLQPLDLSESFVSKRKTSTQDRKGKSVCIDKDSGDEYPANPVTMQEEHDMSKRARRKSIGLPFHGILKKGIRELNNGLEIMKLKSTTAN